MKDFNFILMTKSSSIISNDFVQFILTKLETIMDCVQVQNIVKLEVITFTRRFELHKLMTILSAAEYNECSGQTRHFYCCK